jgi:hypothetical protein
MKTLLPFLLTTLWLTVHSQTVQLIPSINSIGVKVVLPQGYDTDQTAHCTFRYKPTAQTAWQDGFEADRILLTAVDQFRGTVFMVNENTSYDVEVTLTDSLPVLSTQTLAVVTVITLSSPQFTPTANVKWVSPAGSGILYTQVSPGNLATLMASGQVSCGTTVMLMNGVYPVINYVLNITSNCTDITPIQFLAAPGANPVFDGGITTNLVWTPHASNPNLYWALMPPGTGFTNLCLLGNYMLYPYPSLTPEVLLGNFNLGQLSYGVDGFVRDSTVIWINTQSGINPNDSTVTLSKTRRCFIVYGNNHNVYLKFKGIAFKNIARPKTLLPDLAIEYDAIVFDIRNAHQISFDSCNFSYNSNDINFQNKCDNLIIQNCTFENRAGMWTHAMIKHSSDNTFNNIFFPASLRRNVETAALFIETGSSIIIRNNKFSGVNSGVASYFAQGLIEEADIESNIFINNFDAIEADGYWCNLRVWNNEIINPMAGFSVAPPLIGPRYYYRNVVHGMQQRPNIPQDHCYTGCLVTSGNCLSSGVGVKTNSGYTGTDAGNLYFINNTFYANDSLGFAFAMPLGNQWRKLMLINNIFAHGIYHSAEFGMLSNMSTYQHYSQNDNYFSYNPLASLVRLNCAPVNNVAQFQNQFQTVTGSPFITVINPINANPQFNYIGQGGFYLLPGSPLIDQGVAVSGFYDYTTLPDVGAHESGWPLSVSSSLHNSDIRLFPNPASEYCLVQFNAPQTGMLQIFNSTGQLVSSMQISNAATAEIKTENWAAGIYIVQINELRIKLIIE